MLKVLAQAISDYDLAQDDFDAIIDGMEMDTNGPIIAPTHDELLLYCDRVASAVGRLCVPIFGQPDEKGQSVANHLGLALQLTNIIRDVPEDAEIGRLYLPQNLLNQAGLSGLSPREVAAHPKLPIICERLGSAAEDAFLRARAAIALCDPIAMRAPTVMMNVYHQNLVRLRNNGWDPVALQRSGMIKRIFYKIKKLMIALRYGLF